MKYPDDIRDYDNNPMSPLYREDPVQCTDCGKHNAQNEKRDKRWKR